MEPNCGGKQRYSFAACLETARQIKEASGRPKVLHLPSLGIYGNTHLLMQDKNSQAIAERVIAWLALVDS